ncbi:pyridine nucleotide transhydrogenase, putative [Hepatocystis sp. ex Piliocolobus tephrosceles]|nr:pyridine nucleotide transhydrogenase, putative [Hepatocystis sp. ex Piliocolobus tephrosceles]
MNKSLSVLIFFIFYVIIQKCNCKSNLRNDLKGLYKAGDDKKSENHFQIKLPVINFPSLNNVNNYLEIKESDPGSIWNNDRSGSINNSSLKDSYASTAVAAIVANATPSFLNAVYLFASLCFILCLTGLNDFKTSKRGNILGIIGIIAAILVTFMQVGYAFNYSLFFLIIISAIILGLYIAHNVSMVQLPQLVALFHSFVGLAALLVGFSKYHAIPLEQYDMSKMHLIELYIGTFIGTITFIGSIVACCKLSGIMDSKSLKLKNKKFFNIVCMIIIITLGYYFIITQSNNIKTSLLYISVLVETLLGFHLVASIGAADMPIVISTLNSYSGFSIAISGFLLDNNLLIIAGALIGSSGAILSYIMCISINRDILNIVLGTWDEYDNVSVSSIHDKQRIEKGDEKGTEKSIKDGNVRQIDLKDKKKKKTINTTTYKYVAENLINAKNVIIVPGYGAAVSKCQRELAELSSILSSRNIEVNFAIHPVAGRMPGHLNVLLAEANVPYNIVKEMNEINNKIENADMVLVVGANDIVNPSCYDPGSNIYGMSVIEVWKSKQVVVLKRGMNTGYSAIDNPLFHFYNTYMLFGDAKHTVNQLLTIMNDYTSRNYVENINAIGRYTEDKEKGKAMSFHSITENILNSDALEQAEVDYPKARRILGLISDTNVVSNSQLKKEKGRKQQHEDVIAQSSVVNLSIVPIIPQYIPKLKKMGFHILIEKGLGEKISINDSEYEKYGAEIKEQKIVIKESNILLKVDPPSMKFINKIPNNTVLISYLWPSINKELLEKAIEDKNKQNITYIAIDEVPRSSRAQKVDIRSSMSNLQGYRAVIEAFYMLPRFSKSSITAAGKINPAKVFVIGAGVAGLQAIVTAKSMGAIVYAHDVRAATEEEVKSCGGVFINIPTDSDKDYNEAEAENAGVEKSEVEKIEVVIPNDEKDQPDDAKKHSTSVNGNKDEEYEKRRNNIYKKIIQNCDVVICSAFIPGKSSPKLVTTEMIRLMKSGSVAVDLSTEFGDKKNNWGGNIECSESNKNVIINGVNVLGRDKIERNMPLQASDLLSMNIINLLEEMGGGLQFNVNLNNDIIKPLVAIKDGAILYSPNNSLEKLNKSDSVFISKQVDIKHEYSVEKNKITYPTGTCLLEKFTESDIFFYTCLICAMLITILIGVMFTQSYLHHVFLFTLSLIVGYYCVWSVTSSLHTPLMSVTNALSGVIIIGSMVEYGNSYTSLSSIMSIMATFLATVNLSGGFAVTKRMLDMFTN